MQPIFISWLFRAITVPQITLFSDQTSLGFAGNAATLQEEKFSDTIFWVDTVPLPEAGPVASSWWRYGVPKWVVALNHPDRSG